MRRIRGRLDPSAFSLVEILIVIVVIVILSSLLIPQITRVKEGAQVSVARQQQVEIQTALGNWIAAKSSEPGIRPTIRSSTAWNCWLLPGRLVTPA